jgi:cytochrome c5
MSEHEPFIKTPRQLITVVLLAFVVPVLVIVLLVTFVGSTKRLGAGSDAMTEAAIEARIRPVAGFELRDASAPRVLRAAEEVYKVQCGACHEAGVAGAPKVGDTAAWAPRLKAGYEALLTAALKGKGAMPPQGGGEFDDVEIGRAVVLMANKSGGKLEEPKVAPATVADAWSGAASPGTAPPAAPAAAAPTTPAMTAAAAAAAPVPSAPAPAAAPSVAAAASAAGGVASVTSPAGGAAADAGKKVYDTACMACHAAGVAGAPKLGDKAAWAPRIANGIDALTASVIKGKGAMPPRGGSSASDAELKASVEFMVGASK